MDLVKYETEHLTCNIAKDEKGQVYWQIWEKDNKEQPIAIYVDRKTIHLADRFPIPEQEYKHFKEMCEIVTLLYEGN